MHELTLRLEPFEVCTQGLNHFNGGTPVLFIELSKSSKLLDLHAAIWNYLLPFTLEPSPFYDLESWHPHITLAMEDFRRDMLDEVTAYLQPKGLHWRFPLDNFAIACQHADGKAQVEHIFRFGIGLIQSFDCRLPAEGRD